MELILLIMGVVWVIFGTLMLFTTEFVKKKVLSRIKKVPYKKWSPVCIIIGILFFIAAPLSRAKIFITILGILSLVKGFYFILAPKEQVEKFLDWWFNADNKIFKIWGAVALALGVLVLISI